MMTKQENETVLSVRVPSSLRSRIEEFTNESNIDRPSQAVRILLEVALDQHDHGRIDVERLAVVQANATAEALAVMYEALAEVVERVTKR